jgi:hypothetical protein
VTTSDDDIRFQFDDDTTSGGMAENHELIVERRSWLSSSVLALCIAGLVVLVISGGSADEEGDGEAAPIAPTTAPRTTPATTPEPLEPLEPFADPTIDGTLVDGTPFSVSEPDPGVLCAIIEDVETCHLELITASGAAVVDDALVFGYLTPGATSASVRYRSGQSINDGVRIESDARFFALPLRPGAAYRLQYRNSDYEIETEVPLVALEGGPSQEPRAATRDEVPADIAALPFNRRVDVAAEWTDLSEGPMVWSRQPTLLATQPGWGELLRLDPTGTSIERSTPIPSIRLTAQVARSDANYYLGERVPEQIAADRDEVNFPVAVIRIDRQTGEHVIRLFPQGSPDGDISPVIGRTGWELGPELPPIDVSTIGGIEDDIRLRTTDGTSIQLDGTTLLPNG